jgi:hypothetical protein
METRKPASNLIDVIPNDVLQQTHLALTQVEALIFARVSKASLSLFN